MAQLSSTFRPLLVASLAMMLFAGMDAVVKALTLEIGAYNAIFWRSIIGALGLGGYFVARRRPWPSAALWRLYIVRGIEVTFMAGLYFWGLARVPLAEGIALTFIAPLIALYLSAVLLHEAVRAREVLGSVFGLVGVVVIAYGQLRGHPSVGVMWAIIAILVAAVLYAHNLILQRQQAQVAPPSDIAFFNALVIAVVMLGAAPWWAAVPPVDTWGAIVGSALLTSASVMLLAWAYARAEARILLVTEYTAFVWAAILGALFFNEGLTLTTLIGTILIVAGCVLAAWQERSHQPSAELG